MGKAHQNRKRSKKRSRAVKSAMTVLQCHRQPFKWHCDPVVVRLLGQAQEQRHRQGRWC